MNPPKDQIADRAAAAPRRPVGPAELPADRRLPRGHPQPHPLARRQGLRRPLPGLGRDPRRRTMMTEPRKKRFQRRAS
ncbi:MAG: hypothetical protein M0C28_07340 [Candidatus Moduliflexus flocculans]|nr:hypothetical protein [Candidatus Moduliflexus flocculans]